MKLNKKLLVFVLSLVLLVGTLAFAAFATNGDSAVLTVKYMDGTVQTYAEGETIVPPAVPKDFAFVDADGKAYKYTVTGTEWIGLPAEVTSNLLGTTVDVTVAGTKGDKQVFYVTEEQLASDAPITKVYHMNNDVHKYLSSSNAGDKGDGTNTGAASFAQLGAKATNMIRIKLYADVDVSSFSMNLMQGTRQYKSIPTYFDLNGHTVKSTQTGYIDGKSLEMRIYSSVPGAHWYMTSAGSMFRANDDCGFYLGAENEAGKYAQNISFHAKAIFGDHYGNGGRIWGGKYYQTAASNNNGLLEISRRVALVQNAEFYVPNGQAVFTDMAGHDSATIATGGAAIKNCKFYSFGTSPIINATKAAKPVFENCTFVNVSMDKTQGTAVLNFKAGNLSNTVVADTFGSVVFARIDAVAVEGLTDAAGAAIEANVFYKSLDVSETLKVTMNAGVEYFALGATVPTSAGDFVEFKNGKIYANPVYDFSGVAQIVDGKVAEAGEATFAVIFTKEDIAAFTYLDTKTGKLYGVGYEIDCGGTAAGVGAKFYELFNAPASAYTITMYKDMEISRSVSFGPKVASSDSTYNRDYFDSLANGSIVLDLNGTTLTIAETVTDIVNLAAANFKHTTPNTPNGNRPAIFGFEGNNKDNTFTLKSSAVGGKIVNNSTAVVFGVGEGKFTKIVFEGENLTIVSPKAQVMKTLEMSYDIDGFTGDKKIRLVVNGGTYISGATDVFHVSNYAKLNDATFISTATGAARVLNQDTYRKGGVVVENCTFVAANAAAIAYKAGGSKGADLTFIDCTFVNCAPTTKTNCASLTTLTYEGDNLASTDTALAAIYASAPAGTAKVAFEIQVANAEGGVDATVVYGYVTEDQVLTVTYEGAGVTKSYLVGKVFAPIAMDSAYYTIVFDYVNGTANIPVAWAGVPATGAVITAGGTVTATPAENNVPVAFILYDTVTEAAAEFARADSDTISAELAAALAAQANAGTLYVYADIEAPALEVTKALEILLTGKTLTLGAPLTVSAPLTVEAGTVLSGVANPFALASDVTFNGTNLYFASATTVFSGAGNAVLNNVVLYNLASAALADAGVTATVNGAKIMGVSLGATVTVNGTVLGTAGTFDGCVYADGVVSGIIVNNNTDRVTVLGTTYTVAFIEAASSDASKVINVTYEYKGVVRGRQTYFYGSVASFLREYAPGYFFEFDGDAVLTESVTYECFFRADTSKIYAQAVLTDALNFIFYLKVEDPGVLANLQLNGEVIDLASLVIVDRDGVDYYAIPVAFDTFPDALANFLLSVDLMNGDEALTISASAALHSYLGEVLATAEEQDAKAAYAVAEYITTLIEYFDYDFAFGDVRLANLSRVNGLLASYAEYKTETALPTEAEAITSDYIKSVVLVASEQVTFAFRVADDFAGTVEINGVAVEIEKPFDGFDRKYASVDVAFADLDEEITVVVKDAGGETLETVTYSLASYVVGVTAQNEGVTGAYAKALWNLSAVVG